MSVKFDRSVSTTSTTVKQKHTPISLFQLQLAVTSQSAKGRGDDGGEALGTSLSEQKSPWPWIEVVFRDDSSGLQDLPSAS